MKSATCPWSSSPSCFASCRSSEFERLGSNRTTNVDVRVVAATNQDLGRQSRRPHFSRETFIIASTFSPSRSRALRERREDVPLLVRYFVQKFSRRLNKTVEFVPADAMNALADYAWPGNVRELENFIERAVSAFARAGNCAFQFPNCSPTLLHRTRAVSRIPRSRKRRQCYGLAIRSSRIRPPSRLWKKPNAPTSSAPCSKLSGVSAAPKARPLFWT